MMTPYRTPRDRVPTAVETDVTRFALWSRRARRSQRAVALASALLGIFASFVPLAIPGRHAVAPFDARQRRLPPVHVVVLGPWTCAPDDPTTATSAWAIEAKFGRETYDIDCATTFW